jgi:hypothetical protein
MCWILVRGDYLKASSIILGVARITATYCFRCRIEVFDEPNTVYVSETRRASRPFSFWFLCSPHIYIGSHSFRFFVLILYIHSHSSIGIRLDVLILYIHSHSSIGIRLDVLILYIHSHSSID